MSSSLFEINVKNIINTIVRLLPIGFYFGSIILGLFFYDMKGFLLFMGFVINEIIMLGTRYMFQTEDIVNCALVKNTDGFFTLPAPHTEFVSFIWSFLISDMYFQSRYDVVNFIILSLIVIITMWSRMMIGCQDIIDVIYSLLLGCLLGTGYYMIIKDYYNPKNEETITNNQFQPDFAELDIYIPN